MIRPSRAWWAGSPEATPSILRGVRRSERFGLLVLDALVVDEVDGVLDGRDLLRVFV